MDDCKIPQVWCGGSPKKPDGYLKNGTRLECQRNGFGAGVQVEKLKHLPKDSLQRISYIGDRYEKRFMRYGINSLKDLIKEMKKKTATEKGQFLKKILKNKSYNIDYRSYNSVVLFLYQKGIIDLPKCKRLF